MSSVLFKKNRSFFWLCIRKNADSSYNFIASSGIKDVFGYHFQDVLRASPKGWEQGRNNTSSLWVPCNNLSMINVESIITWAEFAGNQCVWLSGNEYLDFCIAADFNFEATDTQPWPRTILGEAEYWLKYHRDKLTEEAKNNHVNNVCTAIMRVYNLLPLACKQSPPQKSSAIISSVPDNGDNGKLAPALAWYTAKQATLPFLRPILSTVKPPMKNLTEEEKKASWDSLLGIADATSITQNDVYGREIIIVDDLYQSGITMQAYAKYLKLLGASRIFGVVCVKSMKNSSNR